MKGGYTVRARGSGIFRVKNGSDRVSICEWRVRRIQLVLVNVSLDSASATVGFVGPDGGVLAIKLICDRGRLGVSFVTKFDGLVRRRVRPLSAEIPKELPELSWTSMGLAFV